MVAPTDNYALLTCESFDYWAAHAPGWWFGGSAGASSGFSHVAPGAGRGGTQAGWWRNPATIIEWSLQQLNIGFPTSYTWVTSGIYLACSSAPNHGLYLMSHGFSAGFMGLTTGTGGKLEVWDFLNFTLGSRVKVAETAAGTVHTNGTYDRIEWYTHRSSSNGAGDGQWAIYVNGSLVLSGTREIWFNGSASVWYGVADHNGSALNTDIYMDDIYSVAGDDTVLVRTLGNWQVDCRFPASVGGTLSGGFTAVGAATTWEAIDDADADDDTTYATGAVPRGEDYGLTAQPSTPYQNYALKTAAKVAFTTAGVSVAPTIRLQNASVPWSQSNTMYSGNSFTAYQWFNRIYQLRPTGVVFDSADIANIWPGVRYGSGSSPAMKLTQLVTEVLSWGTAAVSTRSRVTLVG